MTIRRVLIGTDLTGKSVVVDDGPTPRAHDFKHTPGSSYSIVWETPAEPTLPFDRVDRTLEIDTFFPGPGGTRFLVLTIPPDSVYADPNFDFAAAAEEALQYTPGAADVFEVDNPGMHATPTVDYSVVLDGEIWLELADGQEVHLTRGDAVVLHGARHAWRNKSDRPTTMVGVLVGARA